jgi:hypothetical protein
VRVSGLHTHDPDRCCVYDWSHLLARLLRDLALPGEETPWEFVVDALPRIDSFGKVLGLAFFAIILTFMNAMAECSPTTRSGSDFCSRF